MPKLLSEFLQEQQEPFSLDLYLLERGYNLVKRSARKRRYAVSNYSEKFKSVFTRLSLHSSSSSNDINKDNWKTKSSIQENQEHDADEDEFSSASGGTLSNSSSECCNLFTEEEGDADRKLKWRFMEDKQLSPVSVLEETKSGEASPVDDKQYNMKTTTQGESSTSIYQHKSRQPKHHSVKELAGSNSYDQYVINKRTLQQTKQLLIDCVREVIKDHGKRDKRRQQLKKILDSEELWKLVCENAWLWSQDSIDETNVAHLLHFDFLNSIEEWNTDCEQQKEEISMEIGDAILEGIISEILTSY